MKRMHIHISVEDLGKSVEFYSTLFASKPDKLKSDYARWKLQDPAVNFAVSTRGESAGVNHLGIQVDEDTELEDLRDRLLKGKVQTFGEGETVCCYAESDKSWIQDPAGVPWEVYRSMQDAPVYIDDSRPSNNVCCVPSKEETACCG